MPSRWLGPLLAMIGMLLRDYHWLSDLVGGGGDRGRPAGRAGGRSGWRCDTGAVREREAVHRRAARLVLVAALAAAWPLVPSPAAADQAAARTLCTIRDARIPESSGLAAAGDSLYTVNDGGHRLRVFVLDRSCRVRRTVVGSLDPYDVEDLARAGDGTLWLADTGDNAQTPVDRRAGAAATGRECDALRLSLPGRPARRGGAAARRLGAGPSWSPRSR